MFRGLTTIVTPVADVAAAAAWHAEAFGREPYFVRPEEGPPAYVEFRIGDREDEFGLIDERFSPSPGGVAGAIVYWHVDDLDGELARLLALGATSHEARTERGPGFVTASVRTPFDTILGLMHNAHWLEQR